MSEVKTRLDAVGQPVKIGDYVVTGLRAGSSEVTVGKVVRFNQGTGFEVFQGRHGLYQGKVYESTVIKRQPKQLVKASLTDETIATLEAAWEEYTSLKLTTRATHR